MSDQIRKSDEIERYLLNNERPPVVMHGNNYPTGRDINDFLHEYSWSFFPILPYNLCLEKHFILSFILPCEKMLINVKKNGRINTGVFWKKRYRRRTIPFPWIKAGLCRWMDPACRTAFFRMLLVKKWISRRCKAAVRWGWCPFLPGRGYSNRWVWTGPDWRCP